MESNFVMSAELNGTRAKHVNNLRRQEEQRKQRTRLPVRSLHAKIICKPVLSVEYPLISLPFRRNDMM